MKLLAVVALLGTTSAISLGHKIDLDSNEELLQLSILNQQNELKYKAQMLV